MDDVSRFQKITNIARELLDKGQAQSMQDAMKIAQDQMDNEESVPITTQPIQETPQPEKTPQEPTVAQQTAPPATPSEPAPQVPPARDSEIGQVQVKVNKIIETVNTHTTQVQELEKKLNSIIADLAAIKDEVRRMKENPVTTPQLKPKQASAGQTQFKEEGKPGAASSEVKPKQDPSGHVRSGNYKSEDVSVEKMFYYGNK